jgi:hypothetical protein
MFEVEKKDGHIYFNHMYYQTIQHSLKNVNTLKLKFVFGRFDNTYDRL